MGYVEEAIAPPTSRRLHRLLSLATVCYAVVLVIATHYPKPQEILLRLGAGGTSDKTQHVVAYAVLGLLAAATLGASGRWKLGNVLALMAALALFGCVDEVTQPLFARHADALDWLSDCAGILAGVLAAAAGMALFGPRRPGVSGPNAS